MIYGDNVFRFIIFSLIIILSVSCSSQKKVKKDEKEMEIKKELKTNEKTQITKIFFIQDSQKYPHSSKNNQIQLTYKLKDNQKILYTKEYDFNSDGKMDMIIVYNSKKEIKKIYTDLDFDLKHDVIDYYKNGKIYKRELISNITKKPYTIINYDKNKNIVMTLSDRSFDGKIDHKALYKNGLLYEIQIDSNSDGKFNIIQKIKRKTTEEEGGK